MSRPDRWWRPETNRRPGGGARRRANVRRQTNAAYDAGYAVGYVDGLERTRARDEQIKRLADAADAAAEGDSSLLDAMDVENGLTRTEVSQAGQLGSPYGCPGWCTVDHGDPEQLDDDLMAQSRGHYRDVAVVLRDDETVAVVSLVAVDNLETGARTATDVALDAGGSYTPAEARRIVAGVAEAARIARGEATARPPITQDSARFLDDLENWLAEQNGETR